MTETESPRYALTGDAVVFQPVRVTLEAEQVRRLVNGGPMPPLTAAPSPIAPVPCPGPLALALHTEDEVVVRHGPSAEVRAWLERLQSQRSADTALPIQIFEFPATMLGIQAINARLRTAFLARRLLWGAGPGERPRPRA